MTPRAIFYMGLYRRVKRWKSLPMAGGMLDQEEPMMAALDMISDIVEEHDERERRIEAERQKIRQTIGQQRRLRW